ncbi:MAG: hypothetical protein ACOCZB_01460 [Spirochaetota bacterium]
MSKSQKRARQAERKREAQRRAQRRRRLPWIILGIIVAVGIVAVLVPRAVRRESVVVGLEHELGANEPSIADLITATIGARETVEHAGRSLRLRVEADPRNPDARLGFADANVESPALVATDPYLLAVDRRSDVSVDSRGTLMQLVEDLRSLDPNARVPLVVAGDEEADFAALILYLCNELLEPPQAAGLQSFITDEPDPTGFVLQEWIEVARPAVEWLRARRDEEVIAFNWTDWDEIAVRQAIVNGTAAVHFVPRSLVKSLEQNERFNITVFRPPAGSGRLTYRLVGRGIGFVPGSGPNADATDSLRPLALTDDVQTEIERATLWSAVALGGDPLNIGHRDVVRWFRAAERYVSLSDEVAAHPLFRELHRTLR